MLSKVLFTAAAACGLFVSSVNGHMVIISPVPYGASSLNNSPLEPDGSDFPCKQRSGVYDITTMNNMPVGVPQKLEFKGGATHGGGSCQVSVTLDKQPSKDSDWRVIHSIIGGCPTSVAGNADGSPNYRGTSLNHFEFSVPKGMPNGEYTLAWTWFNKIGNREMYMNCAPITVTGGADDNDVYNTLPSMFKANVPASQCTTTEGKDLVFPNPGAYSETSQGAIPGGPSGPSCGASGPSNYGGSSGNTSDASSGGSYSAPADASSAASAPTGRPAHLPFRGGAAVNGGLQPTTLQTIPASAPTSPAEGGASTTPPTSDAGSSDTPSAAPPSYQAPSDAGSSDTPSPAPPSYQASSSGASNSSASSGSCSGGSISCPSPGNVVCIGSFQWGLCDINNCAVPRELSAGTSCANGVVAKRHVLEHVRRHPHHARKL